MLQQQQCSLYVAKSMSQYLYYYIVILLEGKLRLKVIISLGWISYSSGEQSNLTHLSDLCRMRFIIFFFFAWMLQMNITLNI